MTAEFTLVCGEDVVAEGTLKTFMVNDKPILLARFQGIVYAVDNVCTHDGGDLGQGDVVKGQVQCPRHGARFDLKTGQVTRMPAVIAIKTYEVKIEKGQIYVAFTN